MSHYELPLVFFTVICQWMVGVVMALTLVSVAAPTTFKALLDNKVLTRWAIVIFIINAIGSSLSSLHLGSPFGAYRAFNGIAHSWLSREAVAFVLLNGVMFFWAAVLVLRPHQVALVRTMNILASMTGVLAILASAQLYYQMAAHPFWHTLSTHLSFITTAVLLGFLSFLLLLILQQIRPPKALVAGVWLGIALVLLLLLSYALQFQHSEKMATTLTLMFSSPLFLVQLVGLLFVPGLAVIATYQPKMLNGFRCTVIVVITFVGALCARMLFYGSVMQQTPWF